MESIKEVTREKVTYWLYGTDEEIKAYFRTEPIVPARDIAIHCFPSKISWENFKTLLKLHQKGHKRL